MSTKFQMTRDINGFNGFGIMPTYDVQSGVLAATVAQSVTVPNNFENWIAIFSYTPGTSVWVSFTTTAAVPVGAFSASSSVQNPAARQVKGGSTISLITSDSTNPTVSIEFQVILPYQS
jgi:hypothetical protein